MATAIDPICKMDVDTENPPGGQSEHDGTTYYFCAPGCKVAFDRDPEKYLVESGTAGESGGHDHGGGHGDGHGHGENHQTESKPGFFARLFGKK